ncbi:MAG TPA: 4-hydroxybenzoate octaprenyltransferase [Hyphomicrobiaceae bacterium]|nr:4-hydroxybenzoate octaprenyltransferase [Hyphomicrobiaceae bacterium]
MTRLTPQTTPPTVPDARPGNWVERLAPAAAKPYLRLARFDRPIGSWLLLFPCWWSLALAEHANGRLWPSLWLMVLFFVGSFVMRGAGCTWNDIVDRDFDAGVARTRNRPIPSGQVSVRQAVAFGIGLCLIGLLVLLQLNTTTIFLSISSLALVALYPFAKRFTYWPQVVLGLTFKWGALVGWTAARGSLELPALLLYAGCVLWTIGYDTIYAHQDKEDDLAMGLKSTAIRFGDETRLWITGFYAAALIFWGAAFMAAGMSPGAIPIVGFLAAGSLLAWQVATLDTSDPTNCLTRFKSNREVGWIILATIVADMAWGR